MTPGPGVDMTPHRELAGGEIDTGVRQGHSGYDSGRKGTVKLKRDVCSESFMQGRSNLALQGCGCQGWSGPRKQTETNVKNVMDLLHSDNPGELGPE